MAGPRFKCPKCGSLSFTLFERLEVEHLFRVEKGDVLPMARSEGFPTQLGFAARCDCSHYWIPRRSTALAIMDAENHP